MILRLGSILRSRSCKKFETTITMTVTLYSTVPKFVSTLSDSLNPPFFDYALIK